MSYILEALKKSEQERHIGQVPDISAVQETASPHASRWPWWVAGALIINAIIIAVIALRPWDERATATDALSSQTGVMDSSTEVSAPEPVAVTPVLSDEPTPSIRASSAPTAAAPTPASTDREPSVAERVSPSDDVVRWQDLPADERNRLPVPRIDVHVFASDPARRFVLVNLRKYQEGETLDQGVKLDAISADGIVLSYQGQRYRVDRP